MSSTSDRPLLNMFFEKLLQTHAAGDLSRLSRSVDLVSQEKSIVPRISRQLSRSETHLLQGDDSEDKFSKYENVSVDDVRDWKMKASLDSSTFSDPPSLCESYKSESHVVPSHTHFSPTASRGWASENEASRVTGTNGSSHHMYQNLSLAQPRPRPRTRPALARTNALSYSSDEDVQNSEYHSGGTRRTNVMVGEGVTSASSPYSVWVRRASDSLLARPKKEHHQQQHLNRHNTIGQLTEAGYSGDTEDEEVSRNNTHIHTHSLSD